MLDVGSISSIALLAAVGLVGYQHFRFQKKYEADQSKQKFENTRVLQAVAEGKDLIEGLRSETARLQKVKISAESAGNRLDAMISEAEAEAINGERIVEDLKVYSQSGERMCNRIADLVSAAADLHRAVKVPLENLSEIKSKPSRKNAVVRDRVSAASLPSLKAEIEHADNVVRFPIAK